MLYVTDNDACACPLSEKYKKEERGIRNEGENKGRGEGGEGGEGEGEGEGKEEATKRYIWNVIGQFERAQAVN